jgi:cysteine desulfurase
LVEALERFARNPVFKTPAIEEGVLTCRSALGNMEGLRWLSPEADVLANTLTFTLEGADSIGLLAALDLEGICASSGSACSVGSLEPSHVALAMGASRAQANAMIRFSLGRENDPSSLAKMAGRLPDILNRCRSTDK